MQVDSDDDAVRCFYSGGRTGSGPLTWAQRGMWEAIKRNPPDKFNVGRALPVDQPVTVDRMVDAFGRLLRRHESLRTLITVQDGEPRQEVTGDGELRIPLVTATADTAGAIAHTVYRTMLAQPLDLTSGLPLRVSLILVDELVSHVCVVYSHIAADGWASRIIADDLRRLLDPAESLEPPGVQPLDLAQEQQSSNGRASQAAIDFWTDHYRRIPPATFAPKGPAHQPAFQRAELTSSALPAAVRLLAARHKTSTSTVLLAAMAGLTAVCTGHRQVAISLVAANRLQPRLRRAVTVLVQLGLFVVDVAERPTFHQLMPLVAQSSLRAYRRASYDQTAMDSALKQVARERGLEEIDPFCYFNDLWSGSDDDGAVRSLPDEPAVRAATRQTSFEWVPGPEEMRARFAFDAAQAPAGLLLAATADTRCLPPKEIEAFLRAAEEILIEAAFGDPRLSDWATAFSDGVTGDDVGER